MTLIPTHVVVCGVSGTGKSTVAMQLSNRLGWQSAEGDLFHSASNVAKMRSGVPLTKLDRMPWLEALCLWMTERASAGESTVLACSALARQHRDELRKASGRVRFVQLVADRSVVGSRLQARQDHFMPASLLDSQFEQLDLLGADEDGLRLDVSRQSVEQLADLVLADFSLSAGSIFFAEKSWALQTAPASGADKS